MGKTVKSSARLSGRVIVPGDKSISHRAIIFNSLADGVATVTNFLRGEDCLSTVQCMRAMGVQVSVEGPEHRDELNPVTVRVAGKGLAGLAEPNDILDAGNSGTTMRLLSGVLAGQPFLSVLTGDASLRSRPMGRIAEPLRLMGAQIDGRKNGTLAPLAIRGGKLKSIHYRMSVASAQLKSSILLAGLFADGETVANEPAPSRDHTERMLSAMGARVWSRRDPETGANSVGISPPDSFRAVDVHVPGDVSSAAFWLVAGAIHPDAEIVVANVGTNPTRTGILDALNMMGANISVQNERTQGGEPVADLVVKTSKLSGAEIKGDLIPRMIDEIPVVAVAAAVAKGKTVIRDAAELRVKESDRIKTVLTGLARLGAEVEELPDGMIIYGGANLRGAQVDSFGDHRLAMALAVAGLVASGETEIAGAEAVDVSYPGFWEDLAALTSTSR